MYRENYCFGGVVLALTGEESWLPSVCCEPFRTADAAAEHEIHVTFSGAFPSPPKHAARKNGIFRWREGERFFLLERPEERYAAFARREGRVTELRLSEAYRGTLSARMILESAGLFDLLAGFGMLVLHSAYIRTQEGEALLFSGPSGAGKSTQAALWEQYAGAQVVNGDRALIRTTDGTAHGILYSGTSHICWNVGAPIRAILFPVKAEENRVVHLRPQEIFVGLLNQCAYYPWDPDSAAQMTGLAARLAGTVPVYRMHCRKEESAVRMLEHYLRRA